MKRKVLLTVCAPLLTALISTHTTAEMTISSQQIFAGKLMPKLAEFNGFGCNGQNQSPEISWKNPPSNTQSFAVTAYDPDAPTGSGWWHWLLINLPKDTSKLASGAGDVKAEQLPEGSQMYRNDYGQKAFGGACPPQGDKAHRYQFTVFALNTPKLELPADASAALVGYYLNHHTLEKATLEAFYQR